MPLANYGAANPAATDPWPIETSLAQQANTSPAMAQSMLLTYQMQRQADANRSGQELDQQHQFARDQQKQQLYEALLKAAPEYAGKPGGAALFAALPGSAGLGATPGALGNFAQAGATNDAATNFQHAAAGLASASEGGVQYDPRYIPGLPNANILSIGPNARVQQAEIQERGRMGAAAINANGRGSGPSLAAQPVVLPDGTVVTPHFKAGTSAADIEEWKRRNGVATTGAPGTDRPLPVPNVGADALQGDIPGTTPVAPGTLGETPAQRDTGLQTTPALTNLPPRQAAPQNEQAGKSAAQAQVLANEDKLRAALPPAKVQSYLAAKAANGGKPNLRANPKAAGGWDILGVDGNPL